MNITSEWLVRKLSALLGAPVQYERLNLSLLGGTIEVTGLKVGDFLTAARGVAKVSLSRAFKGEIILRSLTIERPILNVPHLPRHLTSERNTSPTNPEDDKTRWSFDVEKVLIIDGQLEISPKLRIERLLLELKRSGDAYAVTLLAESLVQLRGTGMISGVADLSQVAEAKAQATLELGDIARIRFDTPRLRSNQGQLQFEGNITLAQLLALL